MENVLLITAAAACGLSFAASVLPFCRKFVSRSMWLLTMFLTVACTALMTVYLIQGRWDYSYVYSHTDSSLPVLYRISALWSGQEGSLLLWASIFVVTGLFMMRKGGTSFSVFSAIGFLILLMCCFSCPFAKQSLQSDGLGMPEALQNPWMAVHPPIVFIAYSGMGALAALSAERASVGTAERIRRWTRFSWVQLGLGILTGSIWAYRALGWGGYWAWDPIENAALVPWLIMSGSLHTSKKVSSSRCTAPFILACLGTFLTRSGILKQASAHAYSEGNIIVSAALALFLLSALCLTVVLLIKNKTGQTGLFTKPVLNKLKAGEHLFPRVLYIYAFLIAAGTAAPLVIKTAAPVAYYAVISAVFALICSVLLLLFNKDVLRRVSLPTLLMSTAATIAVVLATRCTRIPLIILLWVYLMPLCLWLVSGFSAHKARFYVLHIGVIFMIVGATVSSGFGTEAFANAAQNAEILTIEGVTIPISELQSNPVLIKSTPFQDVVVQVSDAFKLPNGSAAIPYMTKPFILLFWIGGFITIFSLPVQAIFANVKSRGRRFSAAASTVFSISESV